MSDFETFKQELCNGNRDRVVELLDKRFINKIVDSTTKKRPIHVACSMGYTGIVEVLLASKCNTVYATKNGYKPIHYGCAHGHLNVIILLLDHNCAIESTANDEMRPIHISSANGYIDIVRELIARQCDIECRTKNGWAPIHWACFNGHVNVVKLLIDHKCNSECQDKDGCRPVHMASANGHVDIIKLLVNNKNQLQYKNNIGQTPLDLARFNDHEACVEYLIEVEYSMKLFDFIKENNDEEFGKSYEPHTLTTRQYDTKLSVLKVALQENADKIIQHVMEKAVSDAEISYLAYAVKEVKTIEEVQLIQECLLYRCIRHHHAEGFKMFNSAEIINGDHKIIRSSFLEIAVEYASRAFIKEILIKTIYDEEVWERAKNNAREKNHMQIFEEIWRRESLLQSRRQTNFSILHTAVCDNDGDMVMYILANSHLVDPNLNNQKFGTAIALAHILHHKSCVDILEQYQVDSNTQNKFLETPLHEAIASGMRDNCEYLINQSHDIDKIGFMGFTGLHCAVIRGFNEVCAQLVNKGADCTRFIEHTSQLPLDDNVILNSHTILTLSTKENALTLCMKIHGTIYSCFLDILDADKSNICDGENNSLLHLAVKCLQPDICRSLLNAGAIVDKVNNKANTALLELLCTMDHQLLNNLDAIIAVVNILIEYGADVNKTTFDGVTVFTLASQFHCEKLMIALLAKDPQLSIITENDFLLAFSEHWFNYAEILTNLLSYDFLSEIISKEIIQLSMEYDRSKLIKSLFDKVNSNVQQSVLEDIIYHSTRIDDVDLFEYIIQKELFYPKLFENGETLLTNLLKENKFKFCEKLLKSRINEHYIDYKNKNQQFPLQIAIDMEAMDLIDELINESKDFNYEDIDGKTPLTQLFEKISICDDALQSRLYSSIKSIIRHGGNIYMTTSRSQQVIDACSKLSVKNYITRYYKKHRN